MVKSLTLQVLNQISQVVMAELNNKKMKMIMISDEQNMLLWTYIW